MPKADIRQRVSEALELVQLPTWQTLSGTVVRGQHSGHSGAGHVVIRP
ncbi:MAG: hypothetical protein R3E89_05005 [Thiolinea sp.]